MAKLFPYSGSPMLPAVTARSLAKPCPQPSQALPGHAMPCPVCLPSPFWLAHSVCRQAQLAPRVRDLGGMRALLVPVTASSATRMRVWFLCRSRTQRMPGSSASGGQTQDGLTPSLQAG